MKNFIYIFHFFISISIACEHQRCCGDSILNYCNGLTGDIIPNVGDSKRLQILIIYDSDLISLESRSFNSFLLLKSVQISNSFLPENEINLRRQSSLETIEIENSFLQGEFGNLFDSPSLIFLNISSTKVIEIPDTAFRSTPNVESIILTNDSIRVIQSETFRHLPNLKNVDLRDNLIEWTTLNDSDWLLVFGEMDTRLRLEGNPICASFRSLQLNGGPEHDLVYTKLLDKAAGQRHRELLSIVSSACGEDTDTVDPNPQLREDQETTVHPWEQKRHNNTNEPKEKDDEPSQRGWESRGFIDQSPQLTEDQETTFHPWEQKRHNNTNESKEKDDEPSQSGWESRGFIDQSPQLREDQETTIHPWEQKRHNNTNEPKEKDDEPRQSGWESRDFITEIIDVKKFIIVFFLGIFAGALLIKVPGILLKRIKQWEQWKMNVDGSHELDLESQITPLQVANSL